MLTRNLMWGPNRGMGHLWEEDGFQRACDVFLHERSCEVRNGGYAEKELLEESAMEGGNEQDSCPLGITRCVCSLSV